jgi:predicted nuclease of predicted toxin-antitoxin system
VAPKLLLDEHLSPTIAHRLTVLGFDVTCTRDRGLLSDQDWDLMAWCAIEGRAIVTRNRVHFLREHEKCLARGEIHFGILTVGEWTTEETFRALLAFLETAEDDALLGQMIALPAPD